MRLLFRRRQALFGLDAYERPNSIPKASSRSEDCPLLIYSNVGLLLADVELELFPTVMREFYAGKYNCRGASLVIVIQHVMVFVTSGTC